MKIVQGVDYNMTQEDVVYEYLHDNRSITSNIAFKFGITRLSAVIFRLKKSGVNIRTEMKQVETRYGKSRIAKYYLED